MNEPVRWKSSAFRCCPGPSDREVNVGVRWIASRMTSAARRTSSGVTGASGIASMLDDRRVGDDVPMDEETRPDVPVRIVVTDDLER